MATAIKPTASRYAASGGTTPTDSRQTSQLSGSQNTNTTTSQTQNSTQQTNSNQSQTNNQTTRNFTSGQEDVLDQLIAQLAAGGTPEMQRQAAQRLALLQATQGQQAGFSKDAAFADAQGLMSQQMRRVMESLIPSISRAAEDAGSSGGALRALLMQDAAAKAAESSAALGVQTATNYGNISTNYAQVLEALSRGDPQAEQLLISALGTAKGGTQTTRGRTDTIGAQTQVGTTNTIGSQSQQQTSQQQQQQQTDYTPFEVVSTTPTFHGAMDGGIDTSKFVGTTIDTLAQLSGGGSPWNSYRF
jgi:hypothetical protein